MVNCTVLYLLKNIIVFSIITLIAILFIHARRYGKISDVSQRLPCNKRATFPG